MDPFRHKSKQKRSKVIFLIFGFLLISKLSAEEFEPFSIMLNKAEQLALQQALGLKKAEAPTLYNEISASEDQDAVLFLSSIIHLTSEKWALWLNDQIINNKTAFPGILLKEVMPDAITFILEGENKNEITLGLNQSYSYLQKRVIDGDARSKESPLVKN
jgi:hypothetical protein